MFLFDSIDNFISQLRKYNADIFDIPLNDRMINFISDDLIFRNKNNSGMIFPVMAAKFYTEIANMLPFVGIDFDYDAPNNAINEHVSYIIKNKDINDNIYSPLEKHPSKNNIKSETNTNIINIFINDYVDVDALNIKGSGYAMNIKLTEDNRIYDKNETINVNKLFNLHECYSEFTMQTSLYNDYNKIITIMECITTLLSYCITKVTFLTAIEHGIICVDTDYLVKIKTFFFSLNENGLVTVGYVTDNYHTIKNNIEDIVNFKEVLIDYITDLNTLNENNIIMSNGNILINKIYKTNSNKYALPNISFMNITIDCKNNDTINNISYNRWGYDCKENGKHIDACIILIMYNTLETVNNLNESYKFVCDVLLPGVKYLDIPDNQYDIVYTTLPVNNYKYDYEYIIKIIRASSIKIE